MNDEREDFEVKKFVVSGSGVSQLKYGKKRAKQDCTGCRYLTPSGKFCTVPVGEKFKGGRCVYKESEVKSPPAGEAGQKSED